MPTGIITVIVGVAVLVIIAGTLDWLIAHPDVLGLGVVLIAGCVFFVVRRKRARNRV